VSTTAGASAPTSIVFGTDGWRARIADEFTFDNVRRCADGVAQYVADQGTTSKGVVVAYDRRFASEHFAAAAAEVLLAHDIPVVLATHAVPTQMSSFEVVMRGAAAGIVITASHNPWVDNGFKVKAPTGAAGFVIRTAQDPERMGESLTKVFTGLHASMPVSSAAPSLCPWLVGRNCCWATAAWTR